MIFNPNTMPSHSLGLTFKIVGSDTEPAATSENLIWINTIVTDIPNWGFGAAEPVAATNGDVWIRTGDSSPAAFNATKKNTIMIYPICAHQYINGKWQEVEAKIYCDNKWVNIPKAAVYLLKDGVQNIDLTGGWSGVDASATVIRQYCDESSSNGVAGTVDTKTINKIDLTGYKSLSVTLDELSDKGSCFYVRITNSEGTDTVGVVTSASTNSTGIVTVDLSDISGSYYIWFHTDGLYENNRGYALHSISEIKLEK